MHRTLPYLALFAVVVLLQVFLFDNLSISIYLNPLVYVAFIALLPLDTPPIVLLLSGLATGVTMDLAMGAAGTPSPRCSSPLPARRCSGCCTPVTISGREASPVPDGSGTGSS